MSLSTLQQTERPVALDRSLELYMKSERERTRGARDLLAEVSLGTAVSRRLRPCVS
jgi:hypothetical protein